ncbi:hypothetical protein K461DRAFT_277919 [Myriangium duriaei CBS 260.36]|uniref:DUF7598 domain-containing protein n=1 Tax=Myriangium duriaei CBS 260.36 TaxID=1168546 RepID=A0A9P4MMV3_9PEZI|nr:hypothetical protein K461DRAFT_277919 [Myriangium duriaei CBS 260.36]
MPLSRESIAGAGYVILNCIRGLNIIGFLAIIAASVVLLMKTTTNSSFFFFDALTNVVSLCSSIFLIISELNLFKSYFARVMPLLSPEHGFVTLSLAMFVLGVDLLAKLNHETDTQQALGLSYWRVVISAGILAFILSILNFAASYLFRDSKQGITARQVRAHGAVASHMTPPPSKFSGFSPTSARSTPSPVTPKRGHKSLRLVTEALHSRFDRHPDAPILPSYQASTSPNLAPKQHSPKLRDEEAVPPSPTSRYSRATFCSRKPGFPGFRFPGSRKRESEVPPMPPLNVSAPLGVNPQFAHLVRPDSALHPARSNEGEPYRFKGSR